VNSQTISKGNRIKVGKTYGTVGLVTETFAWYWEDGTGNYRGAPLDKCERVHGLKGKPVTA